MTFLRNRHPALSFCVEHDLLGKPVPTFRIMLLAGDATCERDYLGRSVLVGLSWVDLSWVDRRSSAAPLPGRARPSRHRIGRAGPRRYTGRLAAHPVRQVRQMLARGLPGRRRQQKRRQRQRCPFECREDDSSRRDRTGMWRSRRIIMALCTSISTSHNSGHWPPASSSMPRLAQNSLPKRHKDELDVGGDAKLALMR